MKKELFLSGVSLVVLFLFFYKINGTEMVEGITLGNMLLLIFIPVFFYNAFGLIERIRRPAKQN